MLNIQYILLPLFSINCTPFSNGHISTTMQTLKFLKAPLGSYKCSLSYIQSIKKSRHLLQSSRFARRSMGEPVSFRRFLELLWAGLYRLPPVSFMIPLKLLKLHAYSCSLFLGIGFESLLHMYRLLYSKEDDACARSFQILFQGKHCKNMHVTSTI